MKLSVFKAIQKFRFLHFELWTNDSHITEEQNGCMAEPSGVDRECYDPLS